MIEYFSNNKIENKNNIIIKIVKIYNSNNNKYKKKTQESQNKSINTCYRLDIRKEK